MPYGAITVFLKETLDNLRDRRSMYLALAYPLLGAVLLGLLIAFVGGMFRGQGTETSMQVPVIGLERAPALVAHLADSNIEAVEAPANAEAAVADGTIEFVLIVPDGFAGELAAGRTGDLDIVLNAGRLSAVAGVARVTQALRAYGRDIGEQRLRAHGFEPDLAEPLRINSITVGKSRNLAGFFVNMLPPFIIFTIFVCGVYLAIDTTAGERERGSLEPLLANPIARWELMLGKAGAAFVFTLIAVVVQLAAFKVMFILLAAGDGGLQLDPGNRSFLLTLLVCLPLVLFAVALQMIIATVSRSIKETQTYLGLLPLVPSIPGMILIFVPLQAQSWMMTIPTFGQIVLLGRLMRQETVAAGDVALCLAATSLAAAALLALAGRLYDRDRLLFPA